MEITAIDEEMYQYFAQLGNADKAYFLQMIKNYLHKNGMNNGVEADQYAKHTSQNFASMEGSKSLTTEEAADMSNGWLHGK